MIVKTTGFIGTGLMGQPMAVNLARSQLPLKVWNRTPEKLEPVIAAGAVPVHDVEEIFASCEAIILMLATSEALDSVLGRGTASFPKRVSGKLIVNTATVRPEYSVALAAAIRSAGGRYVEAPVSGSRQQAQERRLVAMLAGEPEDVAHARTLLSGTCKECFDCGPAPNALKMKLAVNLFMIVMVTGLVEAFHFAERANIDLAALREVLSASPMANNVSQVKAHKLAIKDWNPQAALADVFKNINLVSEATGTAGAAAPLLRTCSELYARALELRLGGLDMVAVNAAFERLAEGAASTEH
jgi:3-hydroxyisobutyrate dehydrogenase